MGGARNIPRHEGIAYNPRSYDLLPANLLFKIYGEMGKPKEQKMALERVQQISPSPRNKELLDILGKQVRVLEKVDKFLEKASKSKSKERIGEMIADLPEDMQMHPKVRMVYNQFFAKQRSSGKDLIYFCSMTNHAWN